MATCPLHRLPSSPCPLRPCDVCLADYEERSAIVEHLGGVSRAVAEALATRWLGEAVAAEQSKGKQMELVS